MTYSARLTNSFIGEWDLYVVTDGPSRNWPEHLFERTAPVPTVQERADALARLGYSIEQDATWEWQEIPTGVMDRVELLASVDVSPMGGGA
ncbi:DUF6303 family protein [Streptomyces sp. NPDC002701]|uniref:DUF6303 family protein n=1 Tax=Streptomyces sp. NPDC002701 TaxID=3364661 RepID=UPI00369F1D00